MNGEPSVLVLVHESVLLENRPSFFESDGLHAVENVVRNLWPAIGKTLTTPLWRVFDNVLWSEESLLGADIESGGYNECRARSEKNDVRKLAFRHHVCSLASLAYAAVG